MAPVGDARTMAGRGIRDGPPHRHAGSSGPAELRGLRASSTPHNGNHRVFRSRGESSPVRGLSGHERPLLSVGVQVTRSHLDSADEVSLEFR